MIRIREIDDPALRAKIVAALADRRGMDARDIPAWFELDDHDFVDLLNDIRDKELSSGTGQRDRWDDEV